MPQGRQPAATCGNANARLQHGNPHWPRAHPPTTLAANREDTMMLRNLALAASVLALASCMTASDTASTSNAGYDARIIRDSFGVPHIYGKRNADVAFGLAYAHAEDDWKNIEEVVRASRGTLSEIVGDSRRQVRRLHPRARHDRDRRRATTTARHRAQGKVRRRRLRRRPQSLVREESDNQLRPHHARHRPRHRLRLRQPPAVLLRPRVRSRLPALRPRQHGDVDQVDAPGLSRHRRRYRARLQRPRRRALALGRWPHASRRQLAPAL